jgi:hypothetical protein
MILAWGYLSLRAPTAARSMMLWYIATRLISLRQPRWSYFSVWLTLVEKEASVQPH